MKRILSLFIISFLLTGCSLIPKKVEMFQDKVHPFPELTSSQKELQKEAAQRAKEKAAETLLAATAESTSTNVTTPARDAALLTDVVAESVGAPSKRGTEDSQALAQEVRHSLAKFDKKLDSFKTENNENAGKKIEGTGLLQIPYFWYLGGIVLIVFVGWHLAHTALTLASAANPGALVGVGAMNVTGALAGKAATQLVQGGKDFLGWVSKEVTDSGLQQKITEAFINAHKQAQDQDVKSIVKPLVK